MLVMYNQENISIVEYRGYRKRYSKAAVWNSLVEVPPWVGWWRPWVVLWVLLAQPGIEREMVYLRP